MEKVNIPSANFIQQEYLSFYSALIFI